MAAPVYNPGQPYLLPVAGAFRQSRIAHVTGIVSPTATSFVLKLQSGPSGDPADEVCLCLYARPQQSLVGLNAFTRAGGWGSEEAGPSNAFIPGQSFEVTILCDREDYKVALNRQHFAQFRFRSDPAAVTFLNVASSSADVTLTCVWVEEAVGPPIQSFPSGAPPYPQLGVPYGTPINHQISAPGQNYSTHQMTPSYTQSDSHGMGGKGLLGMVGAAGAAVAGALGVNKLASKGHGSHGYPSYANLGPHTGGGGMMGGGGAGGLLGKTLGGLGVGMAGASVLGGHKKKSNNMLKYGLPIAGVGLGGYALHKGLGGMGHGFHHGSSSSSSSEEE